MVEQLIEGKFLWSPALAGGVLLCTQEGSFELTVGQDLAIGFTSQAGDQAGLLFVETFMFRVLEPAAAVELKLKAAR